MWGSSRNAQSGEEDPPARPVQMGQSEVHPPPPPGRRSPGTRTASESLFFRVQSCANTVASLKTAYICCIIYVHGWPDLDHPSSAIYNMHFKSDLVSYTSTADAITLDLCQNILDTTTQMIGSTLFVKIENYLHTALGYYRCGNELAAL